MPPLRLQYQDRYRLWADLLQSHTDRLFVPTEERPILGSSVPLQIHVAELALPIVARATVVGWRSESARFSRGVFVRIPESELAKCRRFLGLGPHQANEIQGRSLARVQTRAPAALLGFGREVTGIVHNLTEGGVLLETSEPLIAGQSFRLELALVSREPPFTLPVEVSWAQPGRKLVGVHIVDAAPDLQGRLRDAIRDLRAQQERSREVKLSIVVADDDPGILEFLASALGRHGAEVYQAQNGEEAIQLARALQPALVVMDILMPHLDGADVCKAMRADAELADVPVIFASALDPETLHRVADASGATDYLMKPLALTDLLNLVGRYLRQ